MKSFTTGRVMGMMLKKENTSIGNFCCPSFIFLFHFSFVFLVFDKPEAHMIL
jgi:hypothetical protein